MPNSKTVSRRRKTVEVTDLVWKDQLEAAWQISDVSQLKGACRAASPSLRAQMDLHWTPPSIWSLCLEVWGCTRRVPGRGEGGDGRCRWQEIDGGGQSRRREGCS